MRKRLNDLHWKENKQLVGTFVNNRTNEITFLLEYCQGEVADEDQTRYEVSEMTLAELKVHLNKRTIVSALQLESRYVKPAS